MRRTSIALLAVLLALAAPSSALALAGGSTGSGGGSSGGGSSSSGSSSSFSSGSSSSSTSSTGGGTGGGGAAAVIVVFGMFAVFGGAMITGVVLIAKNQARRAPAGGAYGGRLIGNPFHRRARAQQVEATAALADDGYWDPAELKQRVAECFYPIQWSWEKRDVESSRPFVSDSLYERHKLQLDGLEKQFRRNRIADLALHEVELVRLHNVADDADDRFVAYVGCSARDWIEDVRSGAVVNGNAAAPTYFQQYWSFARDAERGWVLDEIQQASEAQYHETAPIVDDDDGPPADQPVATANGRLPAPDDDVDLPEGAPPAKPANWYPDPWQQAKWRWWDGANWSGQTSA